MIDTGRLAEDALRREVELVERFPRHRNIVEFFHTEEANIHLPPAVSPPRGGSLNAPALNRLSMMVPVGSRP